MNEEFFNHVGKLREGGKECIIVTLVNALGSAPQEIGARIIVGSEGLLFGTVGGGKVEEKAIAHARALLVIDSEHDFVEWNLQKDVGMTCGGVVNFYFEKMLPHSKWKIAVFGAGHVAQELVRLLIKLDCEITCVDPRLEWLEKLPEHFRLHKIHAEKMHEAVKTLDPKTFITSMTMGHAHDLPILLEIYRLNHFPYVGVIGSDSKARVLKHDLKSNGVSEENILKLHCPIGEPFGNNQPVEIAISIASQLIKFRDQLT